MKHLVTIGLSSVKITRHALCVIHYKVSDFTQQLSKFIVTDLCVLGELMKTVIVLDVRFALL